MGAALAGIATGVSNLVGTWMQNNASAKQIAQQEQFQDTEASKQRDFEERMSDTAYQRASADMKAAGLNPILAYSQGGASTPAVSAPQGASAAAPMQNVLGQIGPALASALQVAETKKRLDLVDSQIAKTNADKTVSEAAGNKAIMDNMINYNWSPLGGKGKGDFGTGGSMDLARSMAANMAENALTNMRAQGGQYSSAKELNDSITELNKASLPAARVKGSTGGGFAQLLFGSGVLPSAARTLATMGGLIE